MPTDQTTAPEATPGQRPDRGRVRPRRLQRLLASRWFRAACAVVLVCAIWVGVTLTPYLTAPGTDPVSARVAEWARDHGLGAVVVTLEKLQYQLNPPRVGGTPAPGLLRAGSGHRSSPLPKHRHRSAVLAIRPHLRPIDSPALPGEGSWRTLVEVHGQPAVQATFVRPDPKHTSYLSGVVWMSHRYLTFHLHPGFAQPGGSWPVPDWVAPGTRLGLVATWNGAFKLADAHGGFYLAGKTAGRLVPGAASEIFYKDGSMSIGAWGSEVRKTTDVVGVRQNLQLLIDHGRYAPHLDTSSQINWGQTLGGAYYIFRSGVGVTAHGDLVYVSGNALSAFNLARLLRRAGCVRAMELDINPAWVSFMSYRAGHHPQNPTPKSLLPDYQRPANRYYTHTSRDFVAVYAAKGAPGSG